MLTKVVFILLLYGYIAGEDDNRNRTGLQLKKEESPGSLSNSKKFSSVASRPNHRRITYDSKILRFLVPINENESEEVKAKGDLQPDIDDGTGPRVSINRNSNGEVISQEKYNSSDVILADGTYNLPSYAYGPQHHLQYSPQYSNWDVNRYQRNDPCASYSSRHHYLQQSYFGQSSHLQNDPYLSQGTYNIQYYAHQQPQHYPIRLQNYNDARRGTSYNRQFVNPCIPNQPIPPSSGGVRHIFPNINPSKHHHVQPYQPQNAYDSYPPNLQFHPPSEIYGDIHPPQQVNTFQGYPPQVNPSVISYPLPPHSPPTSLQILPPKYGTPRPTPPKHITPRHTPPKYITPRPTPPKYTTPKYITPRPTPPKHTPPIWSPNTKSYYTPPPPSPTPCRGCRPPPPPPPPPCRGCRPPPPPPPCRGCRPPPPPPPPPCRGCRPPPPPCRGCPTPLPPYSTPRTKGYWNSRS